MHQHNGFHDNSHMAIWMVSKFASEELKEEWFPQLSSGQKLASYCLTEPGSGSDAASLRTTAKEDGDYFILNGSKAFISGSGATDCLVLMARTGDEGAKGISCFLIPADSTGIVAKNRTITALIHLCLGPDNDPALKLRVGKINLWIRLWNKVPSYTMTSAGIDTLPLGS